MHAHVLVLNAGSSSLKFALFLSDVALKRIMSGGIDRIGEKASELTVSHAGEPTRRPVAVANHEDALAVVLECLKSVADGNAIVAVGHRIVHGGQRFFAPQEATPATVAELRGLIPLDPEHMPSAIAILEAMQKRLQGIPQMVCFDTAFHHDMPRLARMLSIPRRYEGSGVRRYGFHGLSYEFLLQELRRLGDPAAKKGRIILAHLGNGASLAAVKDGQCIDTSMGLTPASGLMMGSRTGDLDPGVFAFLARAEGMAAEQFQMMVNHQSGLLGVSEISSDMRELLAREDDDARAAEAVALFCYQVKKWIGSYAAALGGLDTLVFSGGIGENCALVRNRICDGLGFLGVELNEMRNAENEAVISIDACSVSIRVVRTDEEHTIASAVVRLIGESRSASEAVGSDKEKDPGS